MSEERHIDDKELVRIIQKLAQGYTIRTHIDGWDNFMTLEPPEASKSVRGDYVDRLMQLGFLRSFPGGYSISDDGHKAYLKSTDELGDGKIYVVKP